MGSSPMNIFDITAGNILYEEPVKKRAETAQSQNDRMIEGDEGIEYQSAFAYPKDVDKD